MGGGLTVVYIACYNGICKLNIIKYAITKKYTLKKNILLKGKVKSWGLQPIKKTL